MGIMSLSEIMDKSIEVLRKNIKSIIVFSLVYGVICFIGIFIFAIIAGIFAAVTTGISGNATVAIITLILAAFIGIAIAVASNVGIIEICGQVFFKKKVEASDAVILTFKSILKISGIVFIIGIISIPAAALMYGGGVVVFKAFEALENSIGDNDWGVLILILVFIVVMLLAVAAAVAYITIFSFSIQAMTIEGAGIFRAIKRSWQLVRYSFWKVFGCVILFYVSVTAIRASIDSFLAICISILFLALKFLSLPMDFISFLTFVFSQLNLPLSVASFAVITPIHTIMMTMLYFNQRIKKEGFDMRIRLREVQRINERKQQSEFTIYNRPVQN
jgi:hypothetical protein